MSATLDAFVERAAIIWADACTCDPMPRMSACACGAKVDAETTAADLVGLRGFATNPAVQGAMREWECNVFSRGGASNGQG